MSEELGDFGGSGIHGTDIQNIYDDPWSLNVGYQCTEFGRGLGSVIVADAAKRDGAVITWNGPRMATAEIDGKRMLVVGPSCTESFLGAAVAGDKLLTKRRLRDAGVPTPCGRLVTSENDAVAAQEEIGAGVVVKPRYGAMGRGVTVNVNEAQEVRMAYRRARAANTDVIIEEFIEGAEYRGHGTPEECVAVFQRLLPNVTGDGIQTIAELVDSKNAVRKLNPNTMTNPIKLDEIAEEYLARHGWDRESIVPAGQAVTVRDVNGITSGGDSRECFDEAPLSVRKVTSAAVAAIPGMDWGGADIIVREETGEPFVMEVNTFASISGSVFPVFGTPRQTADEVWRRIRNRSVSEADRQQVTPELKKPRMIAGSILEGVGPIGLGEVLRRVLTARGYELQWYGRTTYTASRDHESLWFAGCLTSADLTRPHRMLNTQGTFRRLLGDQSVPRPIAYQASNVAHLKSFVRGHDEMTLMIPKGGRFDGHDCRIIPVKATVSKSVLAGSGSWLLQEYPAGRRYTVIASRGRALVVIGRRTSDLGNEEVVRKLSERAVDAVRAVPELRWGAVQLVVPQLNADEDILVEGITHRSVFSRGDYLLAGSFEDFADLVLAGANQKV